ncbi:MAG: Uma2 family endonuclease [Acidobacteria bacterium]|nr:Uma2 family endonuclease [Acidobacteriota bacterium]
MIQFMVRSRAIQPLELSGSRMTPPQYREFAAAHPELRIERTAQGEVIVMAPAQSRTGYRNSELTAQIRDWARADGRGLAFDSSAAFDLPNGSNRSPDWVLLSRLRLLAPEETSDYIPLCPDFVAELRSKSDRLKTLQAKMAEYLDNGARLGWLIDPVEGKVHIYRPGAAHEVLRPPSLTAGPEMPGLTVDLATIWNPPI